MELREVRPLPKRCRECPEAKKAKKLGFAEDAYCYNCDFALERWEIVKDDDESKNDKK